MLEFKHFDIGKLDFKQLERTRLLNNIAEETVRCGSCKCAMRFGENGMPSANALKHRAIVAAMINDYGRKVALRGRYRNEGVHKNLKRRREEWH